MNKAIIFAGGVVVGAAVGSVATYFTLVKKVRAEADEVIENYAKHCEERIARFAEDLDDDETEDDIPEEPEEDPDEPLNEGVKKYHQGSHVRLDDAYNSVFAKEGTVDKDVEQEIKESVEKFNQEINDRNPGVFEITEQQYEESSYSHEELDYEFVDEDEHPGVLTMFGSDEIAEQHYNLTREQLISEVWRWAPDYIDDNTGFGEFYIQNDILNKVFKVNVIMPNEPEED